MPPTATLVTMMAYVMSAKFLQRIPILAQEHVNHLVQPIRSCSTSDANPVKVNVDLVPPSSSALLAKLMTRSKSL